MMDLGLAYWEWGFLHLALPFPLPSQAKHSVLLSVTHTLDTLLTQGRIWRHHLCSVPSLRSSHPAGEYIIHLTYHFFLNSYLQWSPHSLEVFPRYCYHLLTFASLSLTLLKFHSVVTSSWLHNCQWQLPYPHPLFSPPLLMTQLRPHVPYFSPFSNRICKYFFIFVCQ